MDHESENGGYQRFALPAVAILFGLLLIIGKSVLISETEPEIVAEEAGEEPHVNDTEAQNSPIDVAVPDATEASVDATPVEPVAEILWRERVDIDVSALPNDYDYLQALASNGNAAAAEKLGYMLEGCQEIGPPPQTDAEFEEELRIIREELMRPVYESGNKYYEPVREMGGHISTDLAMLTARSMRLLCDGAPMDKRFEAPQWIALADTLNAGVEVAQRSPEERWEGGDPVALIELSDNARLDHESGSDPAGLVLSFGYFLAYKTLLEDAQTNLDATIRPGVPLEYADYFEARLRPLEIVWANDMAVDLIRSSSNCCIAFLAAETLPQ